MKARIVLKGGPGSGHYGHQGRPGKVGGSSPGSSGGVYLSETDPTLEQVFALSDRVKDITGSRAEKTLEIMRDIGYTAKPKLLSQEEYDAAVADGKLIPGFRAISGQTTQQALEHADALKNGEMYIGGGIDYNGIFIAYGDNAQSHSEHFLKHERHGVLLRTGLSNSAKVMDANLIHDNIASFESKLNSLQSSLISTIAANPSPENIRNLENFGSATTRVMQYFKGDAARFAVATGYDAIFGPDGTGGMEFAVLNRGMLSISEDTVYEKEFKGGPGSGHHGHAGRRGKVGGSAPDAMGRAVTGGHVPKEQRVWQGQQHDQPRQLTNIQTGNIGEEMAAKALQDQMGVEFSTLNTGVNNAPIDVAGDHTAVEVKAGPASNGKSAQHWRATISTEGKAERELVRQMTTQERREYNAYKQTQVFERKNTMLDEMSRIAGAPIKPITIGVILTPDGKRGDVFQFDGFHARVGWNQISEENYLGTYEIDDPMEYKELNERTS